MIGYKVHFDGKNSVTLTKNQYDQLLQMMNKINMSDVHYFAFEDLTKFESCCMINISKISYVEKIHVNYIDWDDTENDSSN